VPHVFAITLPLIAPPPGPLSCVFSMHGGGDAYQLFRPGVPAPANMSLPLDDGIVVSPGDSFYLNVLDTMNNVNNLVLSNTDWFGYWWEIDPFSPFARTDPPFNAVIVNLTARRVPWIPDWLLGPNSPYTIDPARVAMVGQKVAGPSGFTLEMDGNHHLHKPVMIGEVRADGQFNVVWQTKGPIKAQPWSPFIAGNDKKKDEPALMAAKQ